MAHPDCASSPSRSTSESENANRNLKRVFEVFGKYLLGTTYDTFLTYLNKEVRHLGTQAAAVHPDRAETARRHPAHVRPPARPQAGTPRGRRTAIVRTARRRAREGEGTPRPEKPRRLTLNRKRNRVASDLATRFSHSAERRGFEPLKPFRGLLAFQAGQFNHSCIFPKRAPKVHNISRFCK